MSQLQRLQLIIGDDEAGHRDVNHSFANVIDNRVNSKKHNEENKISLKKESVSYKEKNFSNK